MSRTETDTFHLFGNLVRFLRRSSDTGGFYCLVEVLTAPGAGAPLNRHPDDDESFYIVDGTFRFTIGDDTVMARAGDFVRVPLGAVQDFRNVGETPGRMVIVNAPGRVHDSFYRQAGEPMPPGTRELPHPGGAPDVPRLVEIARRAGMEILPPPHAAG